MPESPHHAGDQVRDAWVAPDGTEFVTGYVYTGVPGPDDGVIYRRLSTERVFTIVHTTAGHELGTIYGISEHDVYVGGTGVLLHYDGTAWQELALPPSVRHVSALAVNSGSLWLASSSPEAIFHRKLSETKWQAEEAPAWRYDRLAFAGDHLYAGGTTKIAHRFPEGRWAIEVENRGAGYGSFYVASPTDVYVSGGLTFGPHVPTMLHTNGNGEWSGIDSPDHASAFAIWGRSPNEIYLATKEGVLRWQKSDGYARTNLRRGDHLAGSSEKVFVAYEDHSQFLKTNNK